MRYWNEIDSREIDGFTVVLETSWEDIDPRDLFDDSIDDVNDIVEKINTGFYEWFILRARVVFDEITIGESSIGGLLEENYSDILKDTGTIDDLIDESMYQAKQFIDNIKKVA